MLMGPIMVESLGREKLQGRKRRGGKLGWETRRRKILFLSRPFSTKAAYIVSSLLFSFLSSVVVTIHCISLVLVLSICIIGFSFCEFELQFDQQMKRNHLFYMF